MKSALMPNTAVQGALTLNVEAVEKLPETEFFVILGMPKPLLNMRSLNTELLRRPNFL